MRSNRLALQIEAAQQPRESPVEQRAVKLDFVTILLYFRNERGIDQLERDALPSGHASVAGQDAHAVGVRIITQFRISIAENVDELNRTQIPIRPLASADAAYMLIPLDVTAEFTGDACLMIGRAHG